MLFLVNVFINHSSSMSYPVVCVKIKMLPLIPRCFRMHSSLGQIRQRLPNTCIATIPRVFYSGSAGSPGTSIHINGFRICTSVLTRNCCRPNRQVQGRHEDCNEGQRQGSGTSHQVLHIRCDILGKRL